jgi:hypothetical protein
MRTIVVPGLGVGVLLGLASCGGGSGGGGGGGGTGPAARVVFRLGSSTTPLVNGMYVPPHTLLQVESQDINDDGNSDLLYHFDTTFNSEPLFEVGSHDGAGDGTFGSFRASAGYAPEVGPPYVLWGNVLGVGEAGSVVCQQLFTVSFVVSTTGWRVPGQVGGSESASGTLGGLVLGDFTGDGITDVAAYDSEGVRMVAWPSLGETGLDPEEETDLPDGILPVAFAAGELTGDTHDDVVIATSDGGYVVLTWTSGTTFAVSPAVSLGGPAFTSLVTGDFNGDTLTDLAGVVTEAGFDARLAVLLGAGNGTFGAPILEPLAAPLGTATLAHLHAADLDGDGFDDLAFVAPDVNRTAVFVGDALGGLEEAHDADLVGGAHDVLGIGDVDNDGDVDLLVGNAATMEIRVLLNDTP